MTTTFSKLLCFVAICSIFTTSCRKRDVDHQSSVKGTTYALSGLSAQPDFARPIAAENDHRSFALKLKDGTVLGFELDGSPSTMFGKRRTLGGTVEIQGVKTKSIMLIGENGLQLSYIRNGHIFALKSKVDNIDLGYKPITIDMESAKTKAEFAAYAVQNGQAKADKLIASYNNYKSLPVAVADHKYDVVAEQTTLYTLEDETLTMQARQKAEGVHANDNVVSPQARAGNNLAANSVASNIIADGDYNIACKAGGIVVCGIQAASSITGEPFKVTGPTFGIGDLFTFTSLGNNVYTIKNKNSGKYLYASGDGTSNGTMIVQWTATVSTSKQWRISLSNDGSYYNITGVPSGKNIDLPNSNTSANFKLYTPNGGDNQKFSLRFQSGKPDPVLYKYNLEIAYMEPGYSILGQYEWLSFSLISIDPEGTHLSWFPTISQLDPGPSATDKAGLLDAVLKVSGYIDQINRLEYWIGKTWRFVPYGSCRTSCYNTAWTDAGGGAPLNGFGDGQNSVAVVCCPKTLNILAHECGHNLGASHTTNGDIMNNGNQPMHWDADNLRIIRSHFGF